MAKTKTRPTPKRRPKAKPVAERPARPTGRRLNLRIHDLHYARLCEMAAADGLTVTAWFVAQVTREHERRDSLACAGGAFGSEWSITRTA